MWRIPTLKGARSECTCSRVATSKPPGKRTTEQELAGSKFRVRYDNGAAAWHAAGDNWQPIAQVTTGVHSSGRRSPPSHLQPSQPIAQQSERSELRPHWCNQSHSKASAKPARTRSPITPHPQAAAQEDTDEKATLHAGRNGFPRAPSKSRHTGTIASPNPLRILLETSRKKSPTARASTPKVATDSTRKWPKAQPHLPLSYL